MSKADLACQHPAMVAGRKLGLSHSGTPKIVTLQQKKKAAVYVIDGLDSADCRIVAKRSPLAKALTEKVIYEEVLSLSVTRRVRFFGLHVENDDTAWLFIEHVSGDPYSPLLPDHRRLAARWLADLHLVSVDLDVQSRLPSKSLDVYLGQLAATYQRMERGCSNDVLSRSDRRRLGCWLELLSSLHASWEQVVRLSEELPSSVVHGDFAKKNMKVCAESGELLVFDWGTAGWGPPIADLPQNDVGESYWASPDLELYRTRVRDRWPGLELQHIEMLAALGKIVRSVSAIHGDAKALETPWAETVLHKLPSYFIHLTSAIAAAGLSSTNGLVPLGREEPL